MQHFKFGVHEDIDNNEYHGDREFVSSTVIKTAFSSLLKYKAYYIDGKKKWESDALRLGSAFHTMSLEPHLFEKEWKVFDNSEIKLTTKIGKAAFADFKSKLKPGESFLKATEHRDLSYMLSSMNRQLEATPLENGEVATGLLQNGKAEVSMFWEEPETGMKVKTRADYIDFKERRIVDVKTITEKGDDFEREIRNTIYYYRNYDLSSSLYVDCASDLLGGKFDFYWIFVSKLDPYQTFVCKMSQDTYEKGKVKYLKGLKAIQKANKEKKYIGQEKVVEV